MDGIIGRGNAVIGDSNMDKIRLGLIGLGYIGKVHLRNCLKLKSGKLIAVADTSKRALNLARRMGIKKVYTDYRSLLSDDSVNAVIIALPTYLHAQCVKTAAEAKKHIFLEKPLARHFQEGRDVLRTASDNGVKMMVGYNFRFARPFQDLKERIEKGELGEIQMAYAVNLGPGPFITRTEDYMPHPVPGWWFEKSLSGGGVLMDLGCHMINLLRWYLGEVTTAKASLGNRFGLDLEDHATCMLQFKTAGKAVINVGWFSQEQQTKVELYGTVGHDFAIHQAPGKVKTAIQLMMRRTPDFYFPHATEIQYFVKCLREDSEPSPSGEDALRDLEVIEKLYKNQIHGE